METLSVSSTDTKKQLEKMHCPKCRHNGCLVQRGGNQAKCTRCGKTYALVVGGGKS